MHIIINGILSEVAEILSIAVLQPTLIYIFTIENYQIF